MDVNPKLLDHFGDYAPDLFRVQFVNCWGARKSFTGTMSDCLAFVLPTDKIVSVTRVS